MSINPVDVKGQTFGRLTAISYIVIQKRGKWKCLCSCGNSRLVSGTDLRLGRTRSCGCLRRELATERGITHGMEKCPEYKAWTNMKARCSATGRDHKWYGSRGITICERWTSSFENFFADMGEKPSPDHSIDRINNDGNYEPGNCRWATKSEQNSNRRGWAA